MLSINVGLSFTQTAINDLNSDVTILTIGSDPLSSYHSGSLENGTSTITGDMLPSGEVIEGDTGNIFTDTYVSLKSWVVGGVNSLGFLANVLVQPAGFLKGVGVPSSIVLVIQIIWSLMFLILITAWLMGRS